MRGFQSRGGRGLFFSRSEKSFLKYLISIVFVLFSPSLWGAEIYEVDSLKLDEQKALPFTEFVQRVPKGSLLVIGEQHNFRAIQDGQLQVLEGLRRTGHGIDVGMEFLIFDDQALVDQYRAGKINEGNFVTQAWGQADFQFYRSQIRFPLADFNERTLAINTKRSFPLLVKEKGLAQLTPDEKKMLPPDFKLGSESYFNRFKERMKNHVSSEELIARYFEVQSVWDDFMAWRLCEEKKKSENTLVAVVGQFHIENGEGLMARLQERCGDQGTKIISVYQYLYFDGEAVSWEPFVTPADGQKISDYLMIVRE